MSKFVGIGKAAQILGVTAQTLRRWELEGRLVPDERTLGGQRRYNLHSLKPRFPYPSKTNLVTLAYARVSSLDQKSDLDCQKQMLEMFCAAHGWSFEIIADIGSGINYDKKGLKLLLSKIIEGSIGRLILTHRDRLLRFGAELIFSLCQQKSIEVVIINQSDSLSFEEELAQDVLEIITVFSARLYGSRSRKNKELLDNLKKVIDGTNIKSNQASVNA